MAMLAGAIVSPKHRLIAASLSGGFQQSMGEALLENLQDSRRVPFFGFGNQNVKGFGHDNIAHNFKLVFAPDLLEAAEKYLARMPGAQQGLPTITTAGDESHRDRRSASDGWAWREIIVCGVSVRTGVR